MARIPYPDTSTGDLARVDSFLKPAKRVHYRHGDQGLVFDDECMHPGAP